MTSAAPPYPARPFAVLATVLPATFMLVVDSSIVNVAIPSIERQLGASYAEVQLVVAVYQLAYACVLITAARLGDIHGRKRLFLTGTAGFTLASIACGAAPTPGVLIAARTVQGLMAGMMTPQVLSVIQVTFPPDQRGRAFGWYGTTIGLASTTGPLLGGLLIAASPFGLEWRSVFYVNVPIGVAAIAAAARVLPESRAPSARGLDLSGAALITAALFLVMVPLTEGRQQGFPAWMVAMLVAGLAALAAFGWLEARKSAADRSPLVHTGLFRDRGFRRGLALACLLMFGIPAFFFVVAQYLQNGFAFTPLHAGLTTFPYALGTSLTSLASDRLVKRFGPSVVQVGYLVLLGAVLAMRLVVLALGSEMSSWDLVGLMFACGLGFGLVYAPLTSMVLERVAPRDVGAASGVLSTGQMVAAALGVGVIGGLFAARLPPDALAAPPGHPAREVGFAAAVSDALLLKVAVVAGCLVLFFALRRARANRPAA
ncbi:MAG TPA: MFS transporter [Kofleriaceae bacterium]|nr:MFS transporter [Kofleriaceae bacterium]